MAAEDPMSAPLPEGAELITIGGDEELAPFEYDELSPNLVEEFMLHPDGQEALKEITDTVLEDFDRDWEGCAKYREQVKKDQMLFAGELPKKDFPMENAANGHVPILLENILRLATRFEAEIFGDWKNVAKAVPRGMEDEDFADIVSKHLNWQIRNQMPDFKRQMKRTIMGFSGPGDVTVHTWWNPQTQRNCNDYLTVDDFVVPFAHISTDPNYGDVPHYTEILRYYRNQLKKMRGIWYDVDKVLEKAPAWEEDPESPLRTGMAKVQGEDTPDSGGKDDLSNGAPYLLLQYEGWLELPNQDDDRWCQVIVDKNTRRVLSLRIHEEPNWQDQIRYEGQMQELAGYQDAMGQYAAIQQEHDSVSQGYQQAVAQGLRQQDPMFEQALAGQLPQPPPPPQWMQDPNNLDEQPAPVRMEPILLYSHAVAIEPMAGTLGLGPGKILGQYNRAANVALSQFTDSATLNNIKTLVTSENVDFERPLSISPGKINKVKGVSGGELKDSIMPLEFGPANPQLLQLVQLMQSSGQSAAQSPDVLSGKAGKSGETFRGMNLRVEQAVKQITVWGATLGDLVTNILRKNAKLNSVYLSDEEFFEVTAPDAKYATQIRVTREMYQRNYAIELESDMRFIGEEQKMQEADQILQMCAAFPPLMNDLPLFQQAVVRVLATRKRKDLIPFLGPLVPPPMTPLGINPMMGAPPGPGGPPGQPNASGPEGEPPDQGGGPQPQGPQGPQPPQPQQGPPN